MERQKGKGGFVISAQREPDQKTDREKLQSTLPAEPEEALQWVWISMSEKTVSRSKRQGLSLLVFRSAKERALFLQYAKNNGFEILP